MEHKDNVYFEYIFKFTDSDPIHFKIRLNGKTLDYIPDNPVRTAKWALLENEKCSNCPLNPAQSLYCPIALNLVSILHHFTERISYEKLDVAVKSEERTYSAYTTLQRGLSSMLGIYMVSSGCPIMAKLKPMVRYHLPFASVEETVFRSASTYLLGQYFRHKQGLPADLDLSGLMKIYEEVQEVNMGMADRLRSVPAKDANINALIVLDVFAKELPQNIGQSLESLIYIFNGQL